MDKIDRIRAWLAADGRTIKSLADELKMSPQHLGGVLNRRYALTHSLEARIDEVMAASTNRITAAVPPEVEACIRAWAAEAHTTIDHMAEMLLAELLKVQVSPPPCDEPTLMAAEPEEDE